MELKRLFFACAESTGAEFDKNRAAKIEYLETHTQDFIALIEAAENVCAVACIGNLDALRAALEPLQEGK